MESGLGYIDIVQNPGSVAQNKNIYIYAYIKVSVIGSVSMLNNQTARVFNSTTQKEKLSKMNYQTTTPSFGLASTSTTPYKVYYIGCLDLDDIFGTDLPTESEMDAITDITGPINEITTTTKEQLKLLLKFIREGN